MPVTLAEIAKISGVSISTVSRVMNNSDHAISESTRERIRQIADRMGYKPNLLARGLQAQRTFTVGVIVDNISSSFAPPIVRGIQDRLKGARYTATLINSDFDADVEIEAIHNLLGHSVDGVIFVDTWLHSVDTIPPLSDKPFVFVNRIFNTSEQNFVDPDDFYGAQIATQHLVNLGHRRIAYINGPEIWKASIMRLGGYNDVLEKSGIAFDPTQVIHGDWSIQAGYTAAVQLFSIQERPTAIFAGNDLMALGVIYAATDADLKVPEDIAVVGYDNRSFTQMLRPSITTVTMPCYEMGREAAEFFLGQVEGRLHGAKKIRGKLIVRQSCGSPEPTKTTIAPNRRYSRLENLPYDLRETGDSFEQYGITDL